MTLLYRLAITLLFGVLAFLVLHFTLYRNGGAGQVRAASTIAAAAPAVAGPVGVYQGKAKAGRYRLTLEGDGAAMLVFTDKKKTVATYRGTLSAGAGGALSIKWTTMKNGSSWTALPSPVLDPVTNVSADKLTTNEATFTKISAEANRKGKEQKL